MSESPVSYLPDVCPESEDGIGLSRTTSVEISVSLNQRKLRRLWGPGSGLRVWNYPTTALNQADRFKVDEFLKARRGEMDAFYFWAPDLIPYEDFNCGTVSAASKFIIPARITPSSSASTLSPGAAIGTISDIRVGKVTVPFTVRHLLPRQGTYATLVFNSTNQFIDCGTNSVLRPTGDMSIAAWVNVEGISGTENWIVENESLNASGIRFGFSATQLLFRTNQSGANTQGAVNYVVPFDTWVHLAIVRSGTSVTFYVNGVAIGTSGTSISNPIAATRSFRISSNAATVGINGRMNSVRFYDAALSAGEMLNIFQGNATASANLRGHWRLTEGTGTVANDLGSGNLNNGTLTNSPAWVSGEEEITFTGGAQSGAVTAWGTMRERVIVGYNGPTRATRFLKSTSLLASMAYSFVELF